MDDTSGTGNADRGRVRQKNRNAVTTNVGTNPTRAPRFLIIGDDEEANRALQSIFDEPYDVVRADDSEESLSALGQQGADVVLVDQGLLQQAGSSVAPCADPGAPGAVWMAINPEAVKAVGELVKSLAEASHVAEVPVNAPEAAESSGVRVLTERAKNRRK
jgi:DNA-binding NtrC family response regulator